MNPNEPQGNPINFIRSSGRQSDSPPAPEKLDSHNLEPGTIFGTYEVLSFIGTGGMSTVYKARNLRTQKIVALKLMHSHLISDDTNQKRFEQEAYTAQQLDHPHIMHVYAWGDDRGQSFLVMEYLEGVSLSDVIHKEGPMPLDRAVAIFVQAVDALDHAHRKGVIHRDLKPSNIMLVRSPRFSDYVKLLDFGMAKFLPSEGTEQQYLTKTGEVFGSPLYMSPEQCMGKTLDERADIYSMGCLMYEVLTGQPPLLGANVWETFHKQVNDMPQPITAHTGQKDRMALMDAIILKCMAKSPKDRYRYMSELGIALEDVAGQTRSGVLAQIRTDMLLHQAKKGAQKQASGQPKLVVFTLIALTLIVLGFGYWALKVSHSATILPQVIGRPEDFWQKSSLTGQHFFDEGNYKEAEEIFDQAVKALSADHNLDLKIAALYEAIDVTRIQGKDRKAKDYLDQLKNAQTKRKNKIEEAHAQLAKRLERAAGDEQELSDVCLAINESAAKDLIAQCPSRTLLNQALAAQRQSGPDNPATFETIENLAAVDIYDGKTADAHAKINSIVDEIFKKHRTIPAKAQKTLINLTLQTSDHKTARALAEDLLKRVLASGESPQLIAFSRQVLARFALEKGEYEKADKLLRSARSAYENDSSSGLELAQTIYMMAGFRSKVDPSGAGDSEQKMLADALGPLESALSEDNPQAAKLLCTIMIRLADICAQSNSAADKAEILYQRALFVALRPGEQDRETVDLALAKLAKLYENNGKTSTLEAVANRVLSADRHAEAGAGVASDYVFLGCLHEKDNPQLAKSMFEKALTYRGASNLDRCEVLGHLGRAYLALGKESVAEDLFSQGMTIIEQHAKEAADKPDTVRLVLSPYAKLLDQSNDADKSKEVKKLLDQLVKAVSERQ